jgi:hypothetical protein
MSMYPAESELKKIKKWDLAKQPVNELLDFVESLWTYEDRFVRTNSKLYLSTGGWSGNEDIIGALQHNFIFWMMFWKKTQRGGHYWFDHAMTGQRKYGFIKADKVVPKERKGPRAK